MTLNSSIAGVGVLLLAAVISAACAAVPTASHGTSTMARSARCSSSNAAELHCVEKQLRQWTHRMTGDLAKEQRYYGREMVESVQLAWLRYRIAECGLKAKPYVGGTEYPLVAVACEVSITRERVHTIENDTSSIAGQ
jgi:uncharacterized protein YecT (DUF1311 family)